MPVSERSLRRRVCYKLAQRGLLFRRAKGHVGPWVIVDSVTGEVVAWGSLFEQTARELGLLKNWETLAR